MIPPPNLVTKEGYDLQFGTNVVGHFYFTELLMPALIAGVSSSPDHHTRIITTSSSSAYMGKLNYDTFKDGPARKKLARSDLYNQSKLVCYAPRVSLLDCLLTIWHCRPTPLSRTRLRSAMPTRALSPFLLTPVRPYAPRHACAAKTLTATFLQGTSRPISSATSLRSSASPWSAPLAPSPVYACLFSPCPQSALILYPTPMGALTQLFAGTSEEALNHNGEVRPAALNFSSVGIRFAHRVRALQFLIPWARFGKCVPETYDAEVGKKMWEWLDGEVKAFEASQTAA